MKIVHGVLCVLIVGLAACDPVPDAARHTVAEYRADKALRHETFERCRNDPGTLGKTPDCINALEAERLESRGSLRESGRLGLPTERKH